MLKRVVSNAVRLIGPDACLQEMAELWIRRGESTSLDAQVQNSATGAGAAAENVNRNVEIMTEYALEMIRLRKVTFRGFLHGRETSSEQLANNLQLPVELVILIRREIAKIENARRKVDLFDETTRFSVSLSHANTLPATANGNEGGLKVKLGRIVEIYGPSGSGKTFFCMQLAVKSLSSKEVDRVLFLECGNCGVSFQRLRQMGDPMIMEMLEHAVCQTLESLYQTIDDLYHYSTSVSAKNNLKLQRTLLIIDCITPLIWATFVNSNSSNSAEDEIVRQISNRLKSLSNHFCIVLTNNAIREMGEKGGAYKRALGKKWEVASVFAPVSSLHIQSPRPLHSSVAINHVQQQQQQPSQTAVSHPDSR